MELRHILGCTAEETSNLMRISKATVDRDLQVARAWLFRRLRGHSQAIPPLSEAFSTQFALTSTEE